MISKRMKSNKLNNQGLTLVEVVVAVAILSFALLPLFYSFVYSSRFNAKSREQQRATSAAEAILENYKAYPLTEINTNFDSANFMIGESTKGTDVTFYKNVTSNPSTYVIRNMNFEKNGEANTKYDALITVKTFNDDYTNYGGNLFDLSSVDKSDTAIYVGNETRPEQIYKEVVREVQSQWNDVPNKGAGAPLEFPTSFIHFERYLKITVEDNKVTRELLYRYEVTDTNYVDADGNSQVFKILKTDIGGGSTYNFETEDGLTDGKIFNGAANNLYILYFPCYVTTVGDSWINDDNIELDNKSGRTINVYLYKQRSSVIQDLSQVTTYESNASNSKKTKFKLLGGNINLYNNLNTNIGSMASNGVPSSDVISNETGANIYTATPSPIPTADILSEVNVKIYAKNSLENDGTIKAGARLLAEIKSTANGK